LLKKGNCIKNKLKNIADNDAWCAGLQVTVPVFETKSGLSDYGFDLV